MHLHNHIPPAADIYLCVDYLSLPLTVPRRMFPLIQLSLGDLDPLAMYHLLLALRVKDSCRWRFLNGEWTGSEPVIRGVTCEAGPTDGCVYTLPPASGEGWMKQSPVGFSKLKLSNKDNGGGKVRTKSMRTCIGLMFLQVKLSSLHRYQPVAYLVKVCPQLGPQQQHTQQAEASCTTTTSLLEIYEHELPETQFIAVTAYQNDLVGDHNSIVFPLFLFVYVDYSDEDQA